MTYDLKEKSTAAAQPFELYRFQMGGESFFFTSADIVIPYLGQNYQPTTIDRGELEHTNEVVSGQVKVYVPPANPVAQLLIPHLPPQPINLTIFGGHTDDSEVVVLFSGNVASASFGDECEITCNSDIYALQKHIPKQRYESQCAHIFGDLGCTIDLALFTTNGTIAAVDSTGTLVTVAAFSGLAHSLKGGYFRRGNDVRTVVKHVGNQVTLISAISNLQIGDVCAGVAGCGLTYADCASYANTDNFLGFDMMPQTNPFDGSIT